MLSTTKESIEAAQFLQRNQATMVPPQWLELVLDTIESLSPEVREATLRSAEDNGVSLENLLLGALRSRGFL